MVLRPLLLGSVVGLAACKPSGTAPIVDGGPSPSAPVASAMPLDAGRPHLAEITLGGGHGCARASNGNVRCWGGNAHGELGDGTKEPSPAPVPVLGLRGAMELAAGFAYACARTKDGAVQCWGTGSSGTLGDGTTSGERPSPGPVSDLTDAISLAGGWAHVCAIRTESDVRCWGYNKSGQLGDGTTERRFAPVAVSGLSGVASLALGVEHSCARTTAGTVLCWGANDAGQLGDGTTKSRPHPAPVTGLANVAVLSAGGSHSCARTKDGAISCWGSNVLGQLGDGGTTDAHTWKRVAGLTDIVALSAGQSHTCVIAKDATVWCWGDNTHGQLGQKSACDRPAKQTTREGRPSFCPEPKAVPDIANAELIAAGVDETCAGLRDGSVRCWGVNGNRTIAR